MDIIEDIVEIPLIVEGPEVIANEQLMIYVPVATNEYAGVSKPGEGLLMRNDEMVIDLDYLDERYSKLEDFDTFKQEVSDNVENFKTDVSDEINEFKEDISTDVNSFKEEFTATQKKELERIQKEVDNLYVITGATVTDEYPLSQAYSTRETADGNADIIDGALTRVTKIQGATVAVDGTLKNAYFKGIRSTGKNLINPNNVYNTGDYKNNLSFDSATGIFTVTGTFLGEVYDLQIPSGKTISLTVEFLSGQRANTDNSAMSIGTLGKSESGSNVFTCSIGAEKGIDLTGKVYTATKTPTVATTGLRIYVTEVITACKFRIKLQYGEVKAETYEPYKADESFMLDEAVELGKWDYVDVTRAKAFKGTHTLIADGTNVKFTSTYTLIDTVYGYYIQAKGSQSGYSLVANNNFQVVGLWENVSNIEKGVYFTGTNASQALVWFNKTLFKDADVSTLELANAYLQSLNSAGKPLTIAYASRTQVEEALALPTDKYKSWVHGSETQVQGDTEETDNSADGANCTVSQDYYTQKGA